MNEYRRLRQDWEKRYAPQVPEEWLKTQEGISADVDAFVALTQKYVDVQDKSIGKRVQKVKIYFHFVDDVEIPVISEPVVAKSTSG